MRTLIVWTPRLLGVAVSLFLALFALDAFDGRPLAQTLPAFIVHLAPAAVVGAVVAAAWRHPWLGAAGFILLALAYAAWVPHRLDWILVISGPLAVTAALFAVSALQTRRSPGGGEPRRSPA
jgi:hypothetical protein